MVKNRWKWMAALLACCLFSLVGTSALALGADPWEDTKGGAHVFDSAQCLEDPSALEKRCAALFDEFEFDLIIISQYDNSTYAPPDLDHRLEEVLRQRYGYSSYKRIDAAVMFINARKGTCELGVWGQFDSFSPGDGTAFTYDELAFAMIDDLTAQLQLASDKGRYPFVIVLRPLHVENGHWLPPDPKRIPVLLLNPDGWLCCRIFQCHIFLFPSHNSGVR